MLRNRFFRNVSTLYITIAIALIAYHAFLITPSFTTLLIDSTEDDAVRIAGISLLLWSFRKKVEWEKILFITRYETKEYVHGLKIIDIDKAPTDIASEKIT